MTNGICLELALYLHRSGIVFDLMVLDGLAIAMYGLSCNQWH